MSVTFPDGRKQTNTTASYGGLAVTTFEASLAFPPGRYRFILQGTSGILDTIVTLNRPSQLAAEWKGQKILLYSFAPNERIRLFAYQGKRFKGWSQYTLNAQGNGQIVLGESTLPYYIAIIGDKSGKIVIYRPEGYNLPSGIWLSAFPSEKGTPVPPDVGGDCRLAPPSRVQVGDTVHVTFSNGMPLRFRSSPGLSSGYIAWLDEGTGGIQIVGGPECVDGLRWWQVRFWGMTGWIAEGSGSNYYIERDSQAAATSTAPVSPTLQQTGDCSAAPPMRLQVGMNARVVYGQPVRFRAAPSYYAQVLQLLPASTENIRIVGGPLCREGWRWWQVNIGSMEGWISEGDHNSYYLGPM